MKHQAHQAHGEIDRFASLCSLRPWCFVKVAHRPSRRLRPPVKLHLLSRKGTIGMPSLLGWFSDGALRFSQPTPARASGVHKVHNLHMGESAKSNAAATGYLTKSSLRKTRRSCITRHSTRQMPLCIAARNPCSPIHASIAFLPCLGTAQPVFLISHNN